MHQYQFRLLNPSENNDLRHLHQIFPSIPYPTYCSIIDAFLDLVISKELLFPNQERRIREALLLMNNPKFLDLKYGIAGEQVHLSSLKIKEFCSTVEGIVYEDIKCHVDLDTFANSDPVVCLRHVFALIDSCVKQNEST